MLRWRPPRSPGGVSSSGDRACQRGAAWPEIINRGSLRSINVPTPYRHILRALASGLGASVRLKQAFCAAARAVPNTPIASWEEKHAMGKLRKIQMVGWARGRRRISAPVAIAVAAVTTVAVTGAFTGALTAGSGAPGPALNSHQIDQTTQSETAIAVAGSHVAVGYNDSQQSGLFLTAGSDLTGYSYSADGGASFTDGGTV